MTWTRTRTLAGMLAVAAIALGSAPLKAADMKKVEMSIPSVSVFFLPVLIADAKGFYKDAGLDVHVRQMKPNIGVAAAISGDVPFAGAMNSSLRSAIVGSSQMELLMIYFKEQFYTLLGKPEYTSAKDLRGKTVMANGGIRSTPGQALVAIMQDAGVDAYKEMNVIGTANNEVSLQGLFAGAVEGALLSPPFVQMAALKGYKRLREAKDVIHAPAAALTAQGPWIAEHPDIVKAVIKGNLRAVRYILDNPKETTDWMAKNMKISQEVAAELYKDLPESLSHDGKMDKKVLMAHFEELKESSKATKPIDYDTLVNFKPLNEVLAASK